MENNYYFFFKGRVALYTILKSIEIKSGDEIILPGFTCVVVPNAILYCGAKPVYVDIDEKTYNINPDLIEEKITSKTKAIIIQHTFGIPAQMDKIIEIAKKNNLFLIEDSCHAIGSKYNNIEVGNFGDAAFFSSQWSKPVTSGLGGWVKINNINLKDNIEKYYNKYSSPKIFKEISLALQYFMYNFLITPKTYLFIKRIYSFLYTKGIITGSSSPEELSCRLPSDYENKMGKIQKNILLRNINKISSLIDHRKYVSRRYEEELKKCGLKIMELPDKYDIVFLRYPVIIKDKGRVLKEALKKGIEIGDWFLSPVHPITENLELAGYKKGECPIAEKVCEHIINLPTHSKIKEKEIKKIIKFIKDYT
ncbi:MAG: aminotransferase class V-fold PLP-dependent enzyme [Exilispira sp.]|jgi:dTDP-4-amino-4,6-dideoxygalactose transaminase|nr:aminotransferase class V-fold PLP-dependent enzyme [Exilispira sp.]